MKYKEILVKFLDSKSEKLNIFGQSFPHEVIFELDNFILNKKNPCLVVTSGSIQRLVISIGELYKYKHYPIDLCKMEYTTRYGKVVPVVMVDIDGEESLEWKHPIMAIERDHEGDLLYDDYYYMAVALL